MDTHNSDTLDQSLCQIWVKYRNLNISFDLKRCKSGYFTPDAMIVSCNIILKPFNFKMAEFW